MWTSSLTASGKATLLVILNSSKCSRSATKDDHFARIEGNSGWRAGVKIVSQDISISLDKRQMSCKTKAPINVNGVMKPKGS